MSKKITFQARITLSGHEKSPTQFTYTANYLESQKEMALKRFSAAADALEFLNDPECIASNKRNAEFVVAFLARFGNTVTNDDDINGGDAVDWIVDAVNGLRLGGEAS